MLQQQQEQPSCALCLHAGMSEYIGVLKCTFAAGRILIISVSQLQATLTQTPRNTKLIVLARQHPLFVCTFSHKQRHLLSYLYI